MNLPNAVLTSLVVISTFLGSLHFVQVAVNADEANYQESRVPQYSLPDPLTFADGSAVETAEQWQQTRRPQLLRAFEEHVYGRVPENQPDIDYRVSKQVDDFLGRGATLKEVEIVVGKDAVQRIITMLVVIPQSDSPVPVFLALNFGGNHTIHHSTKISLNPNWIRSHRQGVVRNRATEQSRGSAEERWMLSTFLDRGYALATIYYGDIDPDFDDEFQNGVHPLFFKPGQVAPEKNEWGSIAAWAWGLSRGMDYLENDSQIDATKVAIVGHSRLGKTALWAGACDERFGLVISNNSGCGGAALSRRKYGETVWKINKSFPHWFCNNFTQYDNLEEELPVDQHQLIALIAPRPVYVASAKEDRWADPRGEFLSAYFANPVYHLLGTDGLKLDDESDPFPKVDQPLSEGRIGYHVRSGGHGLRQYDFLQYLDFADRHFDIKAKK